MQLLAFISMFFASTFVFSNTSPPQILNGSNLEPLTIDQIVSKIPDGSIVLIGEQHDIAALAQDQIKILSEIKRQKGQIHVGMEFLYWPDQMYVDQYRKGQVTEELFLKNIKWGGMSFDNYREQILFPNPTEKEMVLALNAPRSLTGRVSKVGVSGLSDEEKKLLPPDFALGNTGYFERFKQIMGGHVSDAAIQRYFEAQCVWDDTMAFKANGSPQDEVLVIVVGEFHVQYGGGLPDRLRQRYPNRPVVTISQVITEGLTDEETEAELKPSLTYGKRADYIFNYR